MPLPVSRSLLRHPAAVALRLVLWPAVIMVLSNLAARAEDDALAAGLTGLAVTIALGFLLALADGLVLRARPLVLVWSVTTVLITGLMSVNALVDFLVHGPDGTTWDYAVQVTVEDLPSSLVFFLVIVSIPVALGAVAGSALRRSSPSRAGRAGRTSARLG